MTATAPERLPYEPAFDGLRGASVLAVLLFHAGFRWAGGGFLGVSTFFTLSGFLITTLLIAERRASGTVSMRRFWGRRFRRLWPAATATLLLSALYGHLVAGPTERVDMPGDIAAAALSVLNWRFILEGQSYGDLFQSPSIVQQFWSLSVEEQFYLLVPPLIALAFARRWSLDRIGLALVATLAVSVSVTTLLVRNDSLDAVYYGTTSRGLEILIGALGAVLVAGRPIPTGRGRTVTTVAGTVALWVTVSAWLLAEVTDGLVYEGGLWLYAVASLLVVLACRVGGPVRSVLTIGVLVRLGRISYGVYLFHWPLYRWLTPARLGVGVWPTFAVRVAATLAVAALSYRFLEQPVRAAGRDTRSDRARRPVLGRLLAAGSVAVLVAAVLTIPAGRPPFVPDQALQEISADSDADARLKPGAPVVAFYGDSTSLATALGFDRWRRKTGEAYMVPGSTRLGCGLITSGLVRYGTEAADLDSRCTGRDDEVAASLRNVDQAVVQFGPWDVADHQLPGDRTWRHIGDPVYDAALRAEMEHLTDLLAVDGAQVVWLRVPRVELGRVDGQPPEQAIPTSDPERMRRYNEMIDELAADRPDVVRTLDLGAYLASLPGGEMDPALRPDGVHLTDAAATQVATDWLGPALVATYAGREAAG